MASTAGGYRVAPARLDAAAAELEQRTAALKTVQTALAKEVVPSAAFGQVSASNAAAATFGKTVKELSGKLDAGLTKATFIHNGLIASASGYRRADVQVAASYRALMPEEPLPKAGNPAGVGGAADTGQWAAAIAGNRTRVGDALATERDRLANLLTQGGNAEDIANARSRIALYEDILANDRQILKFDPSGNGRIAELVGRIEPGTRNVGLFVPGVNTSFGNFQSYADLGKSLVAADATGRTAMVVWADGVFPQNAVTEGPAAHYAQTMAPDLKAFGDELRGQIDSHAGPGVLVTAVGHSYGGATVGLAEQLGLQADQVLHVESAGMGHGIWGTDDLPLSQNGVGRYSMTAPLDPIVLAQGNAGAVEWLGAGHGADPDRFPGVTELETGRDAAGNLQWGLDSHSGVLKPGSDSWNNIYGVLTGGPVTQEGFTTGSPGELIVEGASRL